MWNIPSIPFYNVYPLVIMKTDVGTYMHLKIIRIIYKGDGFLQEYF